MNLFESVEIYRGAQMNTVAKLISINKDGFIVRQFWKKLWLYETGSSLKTWRNAKSARNCTSRNFHTEPVLAV